MRAGAALLLLLTAHLASQFTLRSYFGWEFDAGTKAIVNLLQQRRASAPAQAPVGVSWPVVESVNFYRRLHGLDWMAPVTRESPACYFDDYAVLEDDLPALKRRQLEWLYRDPVAHAVLAQPGRDVRARLAALRQAGFTGRPACLAELTLKESWTELGRPGVNGHFLRDFMDAPETDSQRCASASDYTFQQPVPREWIRQDGVTLVETTLDKYYIAPEDQQKLGHLFLRAGLLRSLVHESSD
jgi:hypothetical protein